MGCAHDFIRRRLAGLGINRCDQLGGRLDRPVGECAKLLEPAKKTVVDVVRRGLQHVRATRGQAKMAASRRFNQPGLGEIGLRPMHAIGEDGLAA